jgi:ubiquinone/menaquinone biosynthesis C-methylase UbiE
MEETLQKITFIIEQLKPEFIAEIGCGTGYWLNKIKKISNYIIGVDMSLSMLKEAQKKSGKFNLINADACNLPLKLSKIDFILLVNAIHQFPDIESFLFDAYEILSPGGAVAIVLADIRDDDYYWYIYDYFGGTLELDKRRIPDISQLIIHLRKAGFSSIKIDITDKKEIIFNGMEVFSDPFLNQYATSTLAVLNDEEYKAGVEKIKLSIEKNGEREFINRIVFKIISAKKLLNQI